MSKLQAISWTDGDEETWAGQNLEEISENPAAEESGPAERDTLQKIRDQVSLINKGFVVYVSDVDRCIDNSSHLLVNVTLMSQVNGMQVFGDKVQLKFAKQTLSKLKTEITRAM
jgi:hypothetical protein